MTNEEKLDLLAEVLEAEASELSLDAKLDETGSWDSMTKLALIVCFDDNFGKKLKPSDFSGFVTVGDVIAAMEK